MPGRGVVEYDGRGRNTKCRKTAKSIIHGSARRAYGLPLLGDRIPDERFTAPRKSILLLQIRETRALTRARIIFSGSRTLAGNNKTTADGVYAFYITYT